LLRSQSEHTRWEIIRNILPYENSRVVIPKKMLADEKMTLRILAEIDHRAID
jgi:hypothetical protein